MDDLVTLNSASLKDFNDALEKFLKAVTHQCDKMESGVVRCEECMQDESSKQILDKTKKIIDDIRACINPTTVINQKVLDLITALEQGTNL